VITAAFHDVFPTSCAHTHLIALLVKQALTNSKSYEDCESNCDSPYNDTVLFFSMKTCVPRVLNMINYIFPMHLEFSNENWLSLQQETKPYVGGFPLGCGDHSYTLCECTFFTVTHNV
jgi:hypothetical protein